MLIATKPILIVHMTQHAPSHWAFNLQDTVETSGKLT